MKIINITNGLYLNKYLIKLHEGIFFPFNEGLIQKDLLYPLFDEEFILKRSKVHNVTNELYKENLKDILELSNYIKDVESITLWFGNDAYCAINLLSVLVYLEELNYQKEIKWNLVDDTTFKVIKENIKITLGNYKNTYLSLIKKEFVKTENNLLNQGLEDYLYIKSPENHIEEYIKNNVDKKTKDELLLDVLLLSKNYGLSDNYISPLIDKYKKKL